MYFYRYCTTVLGKEVAHTTVQGCQDKRGGQAREPCFESVFVYRVEVGSGPSRLHSGSLSYLLVGVWVVLVLMRPLLGTEN